MWRNISTVTGWLYLKMQVTLLKGHNFFRQTNQIVGSQVGIHHP